MISSTVLFITIKTSFVAQTRNRSKLFEKEGEVLLKKWIMIVKIYVTSGSNQNWLAFCVVLPKTIIVEKVCLCTRCNNKNPEYFNLPSFLLLSPSLEIIELYKALLPSQERYKGILNKSHKKSISYYEGYQKRFSKFHLGAFPIKETARN